MTASNSTYCSHDRWAIFVDAPGRDDRAPIAFELPQGSGFIARRKQEGLRDSLERAYRSNLERRLDALEKRLEAEPENPEILRAMGLMAYLEDQFERANALFERAHELGGGEDFESTINYAIVLARRGKLQPALTLLQSARAKWPDSPLVLFNLALVALRARRAPLVHEAVGELQKLWQNNADIAQDFHDESVTLDGLAFLLENKPREALAQLSAAARHAVELRREDSSIQDLGDDIQLRRETPVDEPGELVLEGKTAGADTLNNLALAEAELGKIEDAVARLQAALRLEPGHPQVLNNLGVLAYRQGRLDVAWKYVDSARQIEEFLGSVDAVTWNHLGVIQGARGDLTGSLESFQHAGALEHAEYEVFFNVGRAFIEHGKPDIGVNFLRQAFTLEPNSADVHTVLGAAYLLAGKTNFYGEALKHLKRAIQINTHHRTAAIDLVLVLEEIRNNEMARGLVSQALKLFPGDSEPHFLAAMMALNAIGNTDHDERFWAGASAQFDAAIGARPELTAALYNSALCQFMMGFRDTSSKLLEAVVARDSSIGPAYYLIGYGHAVAKREPEALAAWKIAVALEPNNPELHANVASLLYRRGDFQGAIRSYLKAHQLLPQDPDILAALGVSFAQAKMFRQAVTALEQSLQINPKSPVVHSNIGLAYYLFTQIEKAMEHWRLVSQLDRAYAAAREEEQQRSFDDSVVQLRPFNWRDRLIKMAPVLPRPATRLSPGTNAREFRLAVTDKSLQPVVDAKREVERASRLLAWMNLKN